eukprot:scaffold3.g6408.t1
MEVAKLGRHALFAPAAPAAPRRGRRALVPQAFKLSFTAKEGKTAKGQGKTAKGQANVVKEETAVVEGGFRWDPVMQRWARSARNDGKPQATTVVPKSGVAYTVWPVMWDYLKRKGLRTVSNVEARALVAKGAVLLDVRLADEYKRRGGSRVQEEGCGGQHAEGSINVSMFRLTQGTGPWDTVKKVQHARASLATGSAPPSLPRSPRAPALAAGAAATPTASRVGRASRDEIAPIGPRLRPERAPAQVVMASIAQKATEREPAFAANVERVVGGKRKKIVVMCSSGARPPSAPLPSSPRDSLALPLHPALPPHRQFGRETRSLKACYELMQAGFSDVLHMDGGLSGWRFDNLPTVEG